jgi:glutaredoxin
VARFIFYYELAALRWIKGARPRRPQEFEGKKMSDKPHVIFYTKPGCHLCEEAREELARSGCEGLYTFEEVDILSDGELSRRYGWDIPVLLIDGTHAFKHRLTAEEFRLAITQAAQRRQSRTR